MIEQLLFIISHLPVEKQIIARQALRDIVDLADACEKFKLRELVKGEWPDLGQT